MVREQRIDGELCCVCVVFLFDSSKSLSGSVSDERGYRCKTAKDN